MYLPVFSKRHKRLIEAKATILSISKSVRRRLLYTGNLYSLTARMSIQFMKRNTSLSQMSLKSLFLKDYRSSNDRTQ